MWSRPTPVPPAAVQPPTFVQADERPAPPSDGVEFTARCDKCGQDATWRAGLVVIPMPGVGALTATVATSMSLCPCGDELAA